MLVGEEDVALLVALADAGDVAREDAGVGRVGVEVGGEAGSVAGDAGAELLDQGEVLDDLLELLGGVGMAVVDTG